MQVSASVWKESITVRIMLIISHKYSQPMDLRVDRKYLEAKRMDYLLAWLKLRTLCDCVVQLAEEHNCINWISTGDERPEVVGVCEDTGVWA